jgi:hypothetical protein
LEQRFRSVHKTESVACSQLNQLTLERKVSSYRQRLIRALPIRNRTITG